MPKCRYLPDHDHIAFRDMLVFRGHKASSRKVHIKTGYPEPILDRVWKDSVGELDDLRVGGTQRCYLKVEFLLAFMWIHLYPTTDNMDTLSTTQTGPISMKTFYNRIQPILVRLSGRLRYQRWENRLKSNNHSIFFPERQVTGIIDCAPIRLVTPGKSDARRKLYQPKYKFAVYKIQVIISFTGEVIYASSMHPGAMHDSKIIRKTIRRGRIILKKKEKLMGDPAYKGLSHCIVKYPKKKLCSYIHRPLPAGATCNCPKGRTAEERAYNWIFDGVRGRVEKIIGQIVHHKVSCVCCLICATSILILVFDSGISPMQERKFLQLAQGVAQADA